MGRRFNKWLRNMGNAGIHVGDLNQAYASWKYNAPLPPAPAPAAAAPPPPPAPAPKPIERDRDTTPRRVSQTGLDDGGNLKIKKKSKRRRTQQAKGTGQLRINPTSVANTSTAGQAASSGGVNV